MKFPGDFFLGKRFFYSLGILAGLFIFGFFYPAIFAASRLLFFSFIVLVLLDFILLFQQREGINARRFVPEKLSNGYDNAITIEINNNYGLSVQGCIIDEIPVVFQKRDFNLSFSLKARQTKKIIYLLRPVKRGTYIFGFLNIFLTTRLALVTRRFRFGEPAFAAVYPSIIQMQAYELFAISNRLEEAGIKKIRKIGHTMEFDQIRSYVKGDDYRTINWKATARRHSVMVNQYQEEKSQQVFSVIDMGRSMKMPFAGLSLLDYAINASLVISNIAIRKHDKAGLITFSENIGTVLQADGHYSHMHRILEMLYKQETSFLEPDFEKMYTTISRYIKQRSLILLFTNFESLSALQRQLNMLKHINKNHALVVIFFENNELTDFYSQDAENTEAIYKKVIAGKLIFEKKQITKELQLAGIQSILVQPQDLTIAVINKYLEIKARALI